jgi:hypothetical protein
MRTHQTSQKKSLVHKSNAPTSNPLAARPFAVQTKVEEKARSQEPKGYESTLSDFAILNPDGGRSMPVQFKLAIGAVGDKYEHEGERVTPRVGSQLHASKLQQTTQAQNSQCMLPLGNSVLQCKSGKQAVISPNIAAPSGNGRSLPESVLSKMETAFDTDFSSVRIHEGEHASAIGALAFTRGESIHFAPGRYNPSSTLGQRLLGHELAHVVQQRNGCVSNIQGKGTLVNANPLLEAEADRVGERVARGEPAWGHGTAKDTQGRSQSNIEMPIQCNLGIEIEIGGGQDWRVHWAEGRGPAIDDETASQSIEDEAPAKSSIIHSQKVDNEPIEATPKSAPKRPGGRRSVAKGTPIVHGKGFELQAEDSGQESTIEFVTNPPGMAGEAEVKSVMDSMVKLATKLEKRNNKRSFNASKIGGSAAFDLTPGYLFTGSMQATVGVPLACVPALYRNLKFVEGSESMTKAVESAEGSKEAVKKIAGSEPSGEVIGLLTLLKHYLALGNVKGERSFPKGVFNMMARTDFKTMFSMIPESDILAKQMKQWVNLVCGELEADEPVLQQTFSYDETKQKAPYKIVTTRREWLEDMPSRDRLSRDGKKAEDVEVASDYTPSKNQYGTGDIKAWAAADPEVRRQQDDQFKPSSALVKQLVEDIESLYEGIGAYGDKTDAVRYLDQKKNTNAVLIEIRNPPTAGTPNQWKQAVLNIYKAMVDAITEPYGSKDKHPFEFVETDRQRIKREQAELEKTLQALIADAQKKGKKGSFNPFKNTLGKSQEETKSKKSKSETKKKGKSRVPASAPVLSPTGQQLYLNQTLGDGNCFFHAIYEALNDAQSNADTQKAMRESVITAFRDNQALRISHFGDGQREFNTFVKTIQGEGNWATDQTPAMVADALRLRIIIHNRDGSVYYDAQPNVALVGLAISTIHVQYHNSHYDSYTRNSL